MAYTLTPEQIASVSDPEFAFSTERLLPRWEDIPSDFKLGNIYTQLAEALFQGTPFPNCRMALVEGVTPEALNRCVRAHLASFGSKFEHKIAGVGYMISKGCTVFPSEVGVSNGLD